MHTVRNVWIPVLTLWISVGSAMPLAADIEEARIPSVVVGGDRDYPPYEFVGRDGLPAGYNVDMTRAIAEPAGMKVDIRLGSWAVNRAAFEAGDVHVLQGMTWSTERAQQMGFTPPRAMINHTIFARRETPTASSLADLRGHHVTFHKRGYMDEKLTALGCGFDRDRTETPAEAMRPLAAGEDECAAVAVVPGLYLIRELQLSNLVPVARAVATERDCYALRKGSEALLARFTEGLAILKKTGRYDATDHESLGVLAPPIVSLKTVDQCARAVIFLLLAVLGVPSRGRTPGVPRPPGDRSR
jgi:polar amino acid transport system substrate-binding protein